MELRNLINGQLKKVKTEDLSAKEPIETIKITLMDLRPWDISCKFENNDYMSESDKKSPLDITYKSISAFKPGEHIRIVFNIDERIQDYCKFIPKSPGSFIDDLSVTCGNNHAYDMLRNLNSSDYEVSFDLKFKKLSGIGTDSAGYCLGIRFFNPSDPSYVIDVIYDPKVPNDGSRFTDE